jgi:hypothetical protein
VNETIDVDGNYILKFEGRDFFKTKQLAREFEDLIDLVHEVTKLETKREGDSFVVETEGLIRVSKHDLREIIALQKL